MGLKAYIIKKGRHYSNHLPKLWIGKKLILSAKVKMDKNCWFKLEEPADYAINKLVGWSYGFHHKNSIRIGWRPSIDRKNWIELHLYIYERGGRRQHYIDLIECNTENKIDITYHPDKSRITYSLYRAIVISNGVMNAKLKTSWWGYYLFPYFGGTKTAVVDTRIDLELL